MSIETLPSSLRARWVSADGQVRIEVAPQGDGNDNATLRRFVTAIRSVAPEAVGKPVFVIEAAATIVKAFAQAGIFSVVWITLILFVALRRWTDVALTLVPLLVAIVVTLEICVIIGLQLNFANIIALPLLLGVGVAFKIYYVMPAVIEQDAAACNCRIKTPIFPPVRGESDCGLGTQGLPTNRPNRANLSFGDQLRYLEADWRFEPIMNRVHGTPGAGRGRCHDLRVFHTRNQRFLTENVKARVQRSFNELCMLRKSVLPPVLS